MNFDRLSPTRAGELWMAENIKAIRSMRRFPYMLRGVAQGATPSDVKNFLSRVGVVKEMSYCFFEFEKEEDGERAMKELQNELFMGYRVTVHLANSDPKTPDQMRLMYEKREEIGVIAAREEGVLMTATIIAGGGATAAISAGARVAVGAEVSEEGEGGLARGVDTRKEQHRRSRKRKEEADEAPASVKDQKPQEEEARREGAAVGDVSSKENEKRIDAEHVAASSRVSEGEGMTSASESEEGESRENSQCSAESDSQSEAGMSDESDAEGQQETRAAVGVETVSDSSTSETSPGIIVVEKSSDSSKIKQKKSSCAMATGSKSSKKSSRKPKS
ncbi:hypothetical protein cyc_00399 [Cyclospora cayetanensis]|uniref:RRM domain-containing protein n=1 Tax=Cyclospora cayetanensis TaxID=88456 RepID=A0A1D3D9C2_9EIME|nr:hypothetical protein cyc_00399 [Cyclospora cayetanensis]